MLWLIPKSLYIFSTEHYQYHLTLFSKIRRDANAERVQVLVEQREGAAARGGPA